MFDLTTDSEILLYGYSRLDFAINKYDELKHAGYKVLGYIDKNAENIKKEISIPIWQLDEIAVDKKNIIVVIMLQNGRIHPQIAQMLYENGFSKIIYLPEKIRSYNEKVMYDRYNLFLEQDFSRLKDIPQYIRLQEEDNNSDKLCCTEGIYVTKKIPVKDLYVYEENEDSNKIALLDEKIYNGMFDYLDGVKNECKEYLEHQEVSEEKAESFLNDRKQLKQFYDELTEEEFMIIAPHANWNDKGYFNIIDGLHRGVYQVRNGKKEIYIRIKKEDYIKWYDNIGR